MPLIVLTASSILSVISLSTCSGAAPGSRVVTVMVGMSTFGIRSTPSWPKANAPTTDERQDEDRGEDRTANAEFSEPLHGSTYDRMRADDPRPSATGRRHGHAVGQLGEVRRRHLFAGLQAARDLDEVADRLADRDDALFDVVADDDEDARRARRRCARPAAGTSTPGVSAACSMRAVTNEPGFSVPSSLRHDGFDDQRARVGLQRRATRSAPAR